MQAKVRWKVQAAQRVRSTKPLCRRRCPQDRFRHRLLERPDLVTTGDATLEVGAEFDELRSIKCTQHVRGCVVTTIV